MHANTLMSRRSALTIGPAVFTGMNMRDTIAAETSSSSAKASNVIMIWLAGGPATIDMWDMKPAAEASIRGEFKPVSTNVAGVQICEHFPALCKLIDHCLLVRSVTHAIPAHGPGSQLMLTGQAPSAALEYPSLGSLASRQIARAQPTFPPYVSFAVPPEASAGYLGAEWEPFNLESEFRELPKGFSLNYSDRPQTAAEQRRQFDKRLQLRGEFDRAFSSLRNDEVVAGLDRHVRQAIGVLRQDSIRTALQIDREPQTRRERFGNSSLGRNALRARRLIQAGARFVTITFGGWDTHTGNFSTLRNALLPTLDKALAALISDLHENGLLESTIVYCVGEFGRTPIVNSDAGRDHHSRAMTALLAGGGFPGGAVYGATDPNGIEPTEKPCTPMELMATILHQLGITLDAKTRLPSGRDVRIVPDGVQPLAFDA